MNKRGKKEESHKWNSFSQAKLRAEAIRVENSKILRELRE